MTSLTIGDLLELVCMCDTQPQADWLFAELALYHQQINPDQISIEEATSITASNIGYVIGYLNDAGKRSRLHKMFNANHPIFGTGHY